MEWMKLCLSEEAVVQTEGSSGFTASIGQQMRTMAREL